MICAYCGQDRSPTREHVWPDWLHRADDYRLKFNSLAGKVFAADGTVKDVCGACNSSSLSKLDSYAFKLHGSYFSQPYRKIKNKLFVYDYEMLSKFLIKTCYNSARSVRSGNVWLLSKYADCIISEGSYPAGLQISACLLGELIITDHLTGQRKTSELRWCRVVQLTQIGEIENEFVNIGVIINCWQFSLRFSLEPWSNSSRRRKAVKNQILIRPDKKSVYLPTWTGQADSYLQHFHDNHRLYDEAIVRMSKI
jgi:hypothetical protein